MNAARNLIFNAESTYVENLSKIASTVDGIKEWNNNINYKKKE